MKLHEFVALLETQGSDLQSWPSAQRRAAETLLATDQHAARVLQEQLHVETLIRDLPAPEFSHLSARIARQPLPERKLPLSDRLLNWILPDRGIAGIWRPVTAACLPLLFGIVVGNYFNFGISTETRSADYWEDELAMISLTDYTENQVEL